MDKGKGIAVSRRTFVVGTLGLAVCACGENPLARDLVTAYRYATVGLPGPEITRETVNSLPYASIAARIGRGPRSLLVLWEVNDDVMTWVSADNASILTRHGRIVQTAGLPENIKVTGFPHPDPISRGIDYVMSGPRDYSRLLDVSGARQYGLEIVSTIKVIGPRRINITSIDFETILVEERCRARQISWNYTNRFWLDPADGFVWKSEQHAARSLPEFAIEVLKPAQT